MTSDNKRCDVCYKPLRAPARPCTHCRRDYWSSILGVVFLLLMIGFGVRKCNTLFLSQAPALSLAGQSTCAALPAVLGRH